MRKREWIGILVLVVLICDAAAAGYYFDTKYKAALTAAAAEASYKTPQEADPYVRFDMEAYDSIAKNYWQPPADKDMASLYLSSLQKVYSLLNISTTTSLQTYDRAGVAAMLSTAFGAATSTEEKKTIATGLLQVALYNLEPAGRDELLSQQQQQQLTNEVNNANPAADLYSDLGLQTGASANDVSQAYAAQKKTLAASTSPEAKQKLAAAEHADAVLGDLQSKTRYDQTGAQPTVFAHVLGSALYIDISRMSPTTLAEIQEKLADASSTPGLTGLIIDLRGNIGGDLNNAQGLIGMFQGSNQYAFDLFGQNIYTPIRTTTSKLDGLARYRDIAVITDGMTQSTAEVIAAAFKRFHLGTVVGATSRGWGTVENTFPLINTPDASTTYALLLVHYITLRDDGNPIQGRGVDPDVSITDPNWKSELSVHFRTTGMITAIQKMVAGAPMQ